MKTRVRSLNNAGVELFWAWLKSPSQEIPYYLLDNPDYSDDIAQDYFIDRSYTFDSSYILGKYLHEEVFPSVSDVVSHSSSGGLWAWLSLAFITSLMSKKSSRKGMPLHAAHYIELPGQQGKRLAYRLITRTAWKLVQLHGDRAEVALGSKKSPWGEMAEQMTARQEVFAHPSFWAVAHRLYQSQDGALRRGATSQRPNSARKDPKNQSGKGGVRRLPLTFRQFDRTYLTRAMSLEQMVSVLPAEYKKWIS